MPTQRSGAGSSSGNDSHDRGGLLADEAIERLVERAQAAAGRPREGDEAESTRQVRARYWPLFVQFCAGYGGRDEDGVRRRGLTELPAEASTVAEFVGWMAHRGYAPATIRLALDAVRRRHRVAGEPVPDPVPAAAAVRMYESELRAAGWKPRRTAPARTAELQLLVEACGVGPAGVRDRAMVLLGYATAARRATLTRFDVGDLVPMGDGDRAWVARVWRSARQARAEVVVPHWGRVRAGRCADPLCPVCAVLAWRAVLQAGGATSGPLFRPVDRNGNVAGLARVAGGHDARLSLPAVNLVLRKLRTEAGLSDAVTPQSLRAGFAVESIESGASESAVRRHGGWSSTSRAFNVYTRGLLVDVEAPADGASVVAQARRADRAAGRRGAAERS